MLLLSSSSADQDCDLIGLVQDICPLQPHSKPLLVGLHRYNMSTMPMGGSLHYPVESTMQTPRSHLEILPSKHMLLST
jgi:hypothetical protein